MPRPRLTDNQSNFFNSKGSRVLCVGDLHEPFCLEGYLAFCKKQYDTYNCDTVVFIGDCIDSHYSSFHEPDPDGLGGGDELDLAIKKLAKWYKAFPDAHITIGNHDRIIRRKAFSGGIPKAWIKEYSEVLNTPNWIFTDRVVIDGVQYIHGESGKAIKKAKDDMMSTVQGHRHTEIGTEYAFGAKFRIFGCSVGSGINHEAYAFAYGKNFKKPGIGCAIILDGKTAINCLMDL